MTQRHLWILFFSLLILSAAALRNFAHAGGGNLSDSITTSAAGMHAQSARLRVISQNIANADSTSTIPGGNPYRRKTIYFKNKRDPKTGVESVAIKKYSEDKSPFELRYEPSHPAANAEGYVKYPNVDNIIESQDAREAQRSYEANLNMVDMSRSMMTRTLDILR